MNVLKLELRETGILSYSEIKKIELYSIGTVYNRMEKKIRINIQVFFFICFNYLFTYHILIRKVLIMAIFIQFNGCSLC